MPPVYISLGSNLGEREAMLARAISTFPDAITLQRTSSVYETQPWGYHDQPNFLNMVVETQTNLPPSDLMAYLKAIEARLGRIPTFRYGPRTIDLDILLYGITILDSPELVIPHPQMHTRAFILVPLAELVPHLIHPLLGISMAALRDSLDASGVRFFCSYQKED
jgi:2-amino-4-hydroxy-6-hydroxymethyldihydropteridine diphosphokinase